MIEKDFKICVVFFYVGDYFILDFRNFLLDLFLSFMFFKVSFEFFVALIFGTKERFCDKNGGG